MLILFIVLYATYKPQAAYRNGMLFAVTLPEHAVEDARVQAIQERYKRNFSRVSLGMLLSLVPFIALYRWEAYQAIYMLVWIVAAILVVVAPCRRAFKETLALKRENDWFVGAKRVVRSDLRVARLKNQRSAPIASFLIPIGMAAGFTIWAAAHDRDFVSIPLAGGGLAVLGLLMALGLRRSRAKVYSENGEVNLSLNQADRRTQSYMWLWIAIAENLHMLLLYLLARNDHEGMTGVWLTATLLFSAVPVGIVLYRHRTFSALEQEVLAQDGQTIYSDDDEYWANGFTYHNPDDKSLLVPKRVGMGQTINTGTLAGKIIMGGIALLTAAVIAGVSVLLLISETVSPSLKLTEDHRIEIRYPMYSDDFAVSDIRELALVEEIPRGSKTNGESTGRVARGNFRLDGWGKTRLYIYKKSPPYIQMKLDDKYVVFGDEDPEATKRLYEIINQAWQSGGQAGT